MGGLPPPLPPRPTPAGWYADPHAPGRLRWFDGRRWTEHVAPIPRREPEPGSLDAWFRESAAQAWNVIRRVGLVLVGCWIAFGVVAYVAARAIWNDPDARAARDLLGVERDAFGGLGGFGTDRDITDDELEEALRLLGDAVVRHLGWVIAAVVAYVLAVAWTSAIAARCVDAAEDGIELTWVEATVAGAQRIPHVIAAGAAVTLVLTGVWTVALAPGFAVAWSTGDLAFALLAFGLGGCAGIAGSVWIGGRIALAGIAAATGRSWFGVDHSWGMTRRNFWTTVLRVLIAVLVVGAISSAIGGAQYGAVPFGLGAVVATALVVRVIGSAASVAIAVPANVVLLRDLERRHADDAAI